jgi:hypothetical protein
VVDVSAFACVFSSSSATQGPPFVADPVNGIVRRLATGGCRAQFGFAKAAPPASRAKAAKTALSDFADALENSRRLCPRRNRS